MTAALQLHSFAIEVACWLASYFPFSQAAL
jgi:hypothetical protein